jgi:hypothetical protein
VLFKYSKLELHASLEWKREVLGTRPLSTPGGAFAMIHNARIDPKPKLVPD